MANNTQMTDAERGVFSFLHGITGYLVAVVLLLSILTGLTYFGIKAQSDNASNYYKINQDLNGLKMNSSNNHKLREMAK